MLSGKGLPPLTAYTDDDDNGDEVHSEKEDAEISKDAIPAEEQDQMKTRKRKL